MEQTVWSVCRRDWRTAGRSSAHRMDNIPNTPRTQLEVAAMQRTHRGHKPHRLPRRKGLLPPCPDVLDRLEDWQAGPGRGDSRSHSRQLYHCIRLQIGRAAKWSSYSAVTDTKGTRCMLQWATCSVSSSLMLMVCSKLTRLLLSIDRVNKQYKMDVNMLKAAEQLAQSHMDSYNDVSHDWLHVKRVRSLALKLAGNPSIAPTVDHTVLQLAALFHDLSVQRYQRKTVFAHSVFYQTRFEILCHDQRVRRLARPLLRGMARERLNIAAASSARSKDMR